MKSDSKFWDLKPFWCQPWSIVVFGITLIVFISIEFHNIILSLIISSFISIWWILFLVIVPLSYKSNSEKE